MAGRLGLIWTGNDGRLRETDIGKVKLGSGRPQACMEMHQQSRH